MSHVNSVLCTISKLAMTACYILVVLDFRVSLKTQICGKHCCFKFSNSNLFISEIEYLCFQYLSVFSTMLFDKNLGITC